MNNLVTITGISSEGETANPTYWIFYQDSNGNTGKLLVGNKEGRNLREMQQARLIYKGEEIVEITPYNPPR